MKLIKVAKLIWSGVPKLDPMIETIAETSKSKKIIKSSVRVIQIAAAVYLLYKGLIEADDAVDIINGK
jgi:hypothetical protein